MKLPRVRFTVQRMMITIAFLALVLGSWLEGEKRRARFHALAERHHDQIECIFSKTYGPNGEWVYETTFIPRKRGGPRVSLRGQRISMWHREIEMKYRHAALNPWLPVEPVPPAPE